MTTEAMRQVAQSRAQGSAALEKQWLLALQRLASTGLGARDLERLCAAAASPTVISRLARLLSGDAPAALGTITESCDSSRHGLAQWLDALDALYAWLEAHSRTTPLGNACGYIACTSVAAPEENLAKAVRRMLDQYGMDRA